MVKGGKIDEVSLICVPQRPCPCFGEPTGRVTSASATFLEKEGGEEDEEKEEEEEEGGKRRGTRKSMS